MNFEAVTQRALDLHEKAFMPLSQALELALSEAGPAGSLLADERIWKLYESITQVVAVLGYHGEISARDDRVQAVMNALHAIDGGITATRNAPAGVERR